MRCQGIELNDSGVDAHMHRDDEEVPTLERHCRASSEPRDVFNPFAHLYRIRATVRMRMSSTLKHVDGCVWDARIRVGKPEMYLTLT